MEEIKKHKLDKIDDIPPGMLRDAFQNCDYLSYVVKEALRYDTPGPLTLTYSTFDKVKICGVTIPKGQEMSVGITYPHFNPTQWQRPEEFIPERFDHESELFFRPGTNSVRHPKSFNSFSNGRRKCVGQSLAMLSTKIMLGRILTTIDYDVTQDLLDRKKPSFDMFSGTDLTIIVK